MNLNNLIRPGMIRNMQPVFAPDDVLTAPPPPPPAAAWYDGADADTVGAIQNRGWDKLDPAKAALEAVKAHREAEKFLGVPSTQIARIPTDAKDEAGWKALRTRLGAPAEAKDYDFSTVKLADGSALSEGFANDLRDAAFARGLGKDDAVFIADTYAKYQDKQSAAKLADTSAKLQAEKDGLKSDWGQAHEANMFIAKQAATKLGISADAVAALENAAGYRATMNMFQKIGVTMGEDRFVNNPNPGAPGVMGPAQAQARINDLKADTAWVKRYMDGDTTARREMDALTSIVTGESWAEQRPS